MRHYDYSAENPTLAKEVRSIEATEPQLGIRARLLKALAQHHKAQDVGTVALYPLVDNAPHQPFNLDYILERLYHSICHEQEHKNFFEAIRLQHLAFLLEDGAISPVQVAREAWLRPASYRLTS